MKEFGRVQIFSAGRLFYQKRIPNDKSGLIVADEAKAPTLVSPSDGAITPVHITFTWRKENVLTYILQVLKQGPDHLEVVFEKQTQDTSVTADSLAYNTQYFWWVRGINQVGEIGPWSISRQFTTEKLVGVDEIGVPYKFELSQNYPNPFNPSTTIKFSILSVGAEHVQPLHVSLKVYDLLGREITTLVNEEKAPGNYEVKFNVETRRGESLPSGIYFYRLQAGSYSQTKKLLVIK